jgi:hypothetical protein
VEVIVSDGFNTASDVFDGVIVPGKAPRVFIQSPEPAGSVTGNGPVMFVAFAQDAEDGLLDPESVEWTSDVDGRLGSGGELIVDPVSITPGLHQVTASVTDSSGMNAEASINITFALADVR